MLALACNDTVPAATGGAGGASGTSAASTSGVTSSTSTGKPSSTTSTGAGGDAGAPVDRGPKRVAIDGKPNGLFWDPATGTLFLADDQNDRILRWTDAGGFGAPLALPAAPANGPGLGQVVETADGTLYVARFGFGSAGDIAFVKKDGSSGVIPGLDPTKRRIGLTVAADGTMYESYFVVTPTGHVGAIARVSPAGGETDVVTGLQKPVGVLAVGADLFISDQDAGAVLKAPVASPASLSSLAQLASPDLLSAGPGGSLFTGGTTSVRQIQPSGQYTVVSSGYTDVRGTAYDAKNRRLFAADAVTGSASFSIVPIN